MGYAQFWGGGYHSRGTSDPTGPENRNVPVLEGHRVAKVGRGYILDTQLSRIPSMQMETLVSTDRYITVVLG